MNMQGQSESPSRKPTIISVICIIFAITLPLFFTVVSSSKDCNSGPLNIIKGTEIYHTSYVKTINGQPTRVGNSNYSEYNKDYLLLGTFIIIMATIAFVDIERKYKAVAPGRATSHKLILGYIGSTLGVICGIFIVYILIGMLMCYTW